LADKSELEIINAHRTDGAFAEIEKLVAGRRAFPRDHGHLVVAIEMVLVGPVADLHAFEQVGRDRGVARRLKEGGEPVQARHEAESVNLGGIMAEVVVKVGQFEIVSAITRGSVELMGLKVGDQVKVVIKATEVWWTSRSGYPYTRGCIRVVESLLLGRLLETDAVRQGRFFVPAAKNGIVIDRLTPGEEPEQDCRDRRSDVSHGRLHRQTGNNAASGSRGQSRRGTKSERNARLILLTGLSAHQVHGTPTIAAVSTPDHAGLELHCPPLPPAERDPRRNR
jgi:molybdopterin-binding protein